ncbi:MAG: hypothetical protein ABI467_17350 [Kofleriaceae bacterium]
MSHEHVAKGRGQDATKVEHAQPSAVESTEVLIDVIDRQAIDFERRLDTGTVPSPSEIATARNAFEQEQSELQGHLLQLPARSATMVTAFHASDRISRLLERFDALDRARQARAAVASESTHESDASTLADAESAMPTGYCDEAPQGVAPCQLDVTKRDRYRRRIESDLGLATTNWVSAIDSKALAQRFKKEGISFEKKLGELLFGSLFGIIGLAAKAAVHAAVDKGAQLMAHRIELPNVPGSIVEPVSAGNIAAAKQVGETMTNAGTSAAATHVEAEANERRTRTTAQLAATAASAIEVASDEHSFIDGLRDAPGKWQTNISAHIDQLFDVDLAGLALGLERAQSQLTVEALKQRIDTALLAFADQVTILDRRSDVIVIGVGMRDGSVKHALVEPERVNSDRFRTGEFAGTTTTVTTGNWTFLRWIDDDLDATALAHARANDWSAGASIDAFDDGGFTEGRNFQLLSGRRP